MAVLSAYADHVVVEDDAAHAGEHGAAGLQRIAAPSDGLLGALLTWAAAVFSPAS